MKIYQVEIEYDSPSTILITTSKESVLKMIEKKNQFKGDMWIHIWENDQEIDSWVHPDSFS